MVFSTDEEIDRFVKAIRGLKQTKAGRHKKMSDHVHLQDYGLGTGRISDSPTEIIFFGPRYWAKSNQDQQTRRRRFVQEAKKVLSKALSASGSP